MKYGLLGKRWLSSSPWNVTPFQRLIFHSAACCEHTRLYIEAYIHSDNIYVNGSAWESGSLQNDAWIIRNKKWLPAFDLHLMVPSCSGMKVAIWILWIDGLVSFKRTNFFQYWISPSGRRGIIFLHQLHAMLSRQSFRVVRPWGFLLALYTPVLLQYAAM